MHLLHSFQIQGFQPKTVTDLARNQGRGKPGNCSPRNFQAIVQFLGTTSHNHFVTTGVPSHTVCTNTIHRAGLKPMQPMKLPWVARHSVWVDCSFLPDTPST